jgi:GT2 family glycosyltransferase
MADQPKKTKGRSSKTKSLKKQSPRSRPAPRPLPVVPAETGSSVKPSYSLPSPRPPTAHPVPLLQRMEEDFERVLGRPKVSVVIVNHDGVDFLWHCLFALKTQTYPIHEIILVDNASDDASLSFVRANYPQVEILECQENFGFAMGSNLGAATATGDLVALLNNDAVVTPDWLSRMVRDFQDHWPSVGVLSSAVKTNQGMEENQAGDHWTLNFLGNPVEGFFEDPQSVFYPDGCALLYARFLAADGPFDPDYFIYQEDVYLGWKFRLLNRGSRRSATAKVFHEGGGTMSRFPGWKSHYYKTRNRWLNLLLLYQTGNLLRVLPWMGLESLVLLVKSLGAGFDAFFGTLAAMFWISTHPLLISRKRRVLQEKRRVPDGEILKCLSGRLARDGGWLSRLLNFSSLLYCLVVGLEVMEFPKDE